MKKIWHIAITGGPCGGKTTALTYLVQKLQERGFMVLVVPEAATIAILGGINPLDFRIGSLLTQEAIIGIAYHLEMQFRQLAQQLTGSAPIIILYDRGIADASAYIDRESYEMLVDKFNLHPVDIRDSRYDGIFHLVTAAQGAERFYTLQNNSARHETIEQARKQDQRTIAAWIGSEHFRMLDNSTDFEGKLRRLYAEICHLIGVPPVERERKFLVSFNQKQVPPEAQCVAIEQFYLASPDPQVVTRLRKRSIQGHASYYRTKKRAIGPGEHVEIQDFITEGQYIFGAEFQRPNTGVVKKVRTCFPYQYQYFELDVFQDARAIPADGLLELEVIDLTHEVIFPQWINVEREVTGEDEFSNFAIAQRLT